MTGLPPPLRYELAEQVTAIIMSVAEAGRRIDQKWGIGRLPTLVPPEWAARFAAQKRKWQSVDIVDVDGARKHGDAMLRAFAKLEELAGEAGHKPVSPDQWEMYVDGRLIILARDIRDNDRVETGGRQCEVWSLDEIASVIRLHPSIAPVKQIMPGARVKPVRDSRLEDTFDGLPF